MSTAHVWLLGSCCDICAVSAHISSVAYLTCLGLVIWTQAITLFKLSSKKTKHADQSSRAEKALKATHVISATASEVTSRQGHATGIISTHKYMWWSFWQSSLPEWLMLYSFQIMVTARLDVSV